MRVAFSPEDYTTIPTQNEAFAAVAGNKILADGSPGSEIDASFEVRGGDILVRKTRFGAFSTTDRYTHLHGDGIDYPRRPRDLHQGRRADVIQTRDLSALGKSS